MNPTRRIAMPGPEQHPRAIAIPTSVQERSVLLQPGQTLLKAIANAVGHCPGAVLHLTGGGFGPFNYVIPALSKTPEYAAFYSDTRTMTGITKLDEARITYGTRNGEPWLHCHGFWTEADGTRSGGHVLPDITFIAQPIETQAWLTENAAFTARHDPETNFTLFGPEPTTGHGESLAIRLRPNQDICTTLEQLCTDHSITRATIRGGVASIIGAAFNDGRTTEPFATEIYIRSGWATPTTSHLDIALVNYLGELHEGTLMRGTNPVLMTAELLLQKIA